MLELRNHLPLTESHVAKLRTSQLIVALAKWAQHPWAAGLEDNEAKQRFTQLIMAELDRRIPLRTTP